MSIIGDKIHRIRDFRGMTQKQLGMAVGFDEKSADVRIAQYESGTRTPKQALVELLAEALDVNPRFLADDEILGAEGVMMMLFELDEHYPISIEDCEDVTVKYSVHRHKQQALSHSVKGLSAFCDNGIFT